MKRILMTFLMLVFTLTIWAQSINVSSFKLLENDLDANTAGTIEKDQNGEVAALIKVVTTQTGFTFEGDAHGIVKALQKPAEIWVYVPRGMKRISISHPQLGVLRDYSLPLPIESARTYEMVLLTGTVETIVGQSQTSQAEISSSPAMADIYIDDKNVGQTPKLITDLTIGKHKVLIRKEGYKDYTDTLHIKGNETAAFSAVLENLADSRVSVISSDENRKIINVGEASFCMIRVDGGTFMMGATSEQGSDAHGFEEPVHEVTLSPYYIGETEVTQELWETVMGENPSLYKSINRPVERVTWHDCFNFIMKLNEETGLQFSLPTEAEWEFAARGGNKSQGFKYSGSNDLDEVAWYWENSGNKRQKGDPTWKKLNDYKNQCRPHDVKTKKANELGIYDMSGNVYEWVLDTEGHYSSSAQTDPVCQKASYSRICRGGSCEKGKSGCRVSARSSEPIQYGFKDPTHGLRLVLKDKKI